MTRKHGPRLRPCTGRPTAAILGAAVLLILGIALLHPLSARGQASAGAAKAAVTRSSVVEFSVSLQQVRVVRHGSLRYLQGTPVGTGTVHWTRPVKALQRLRGREVLAVWEGVQERHRVQVRVGSARIMLDSPRLVGRQLRARIVGAVPRLAGKATIVGRLQNGDSRVVDGCPLAPFVQCPGISATFAELRDADLRGADLRDASLPAALMHGTVLAGADLRGADLRGASLTGADLRGALLSTADLSDANLRAARARPAQLALAHLCSTQMTGGRLSSRDCDRRSTSHGPRVSHVAASGFATAVGPPLLGLRPQVARRTAKPRVAARPLATLSAATAQSAFTPLHALPAAQAAATCIFYSSTKDTDGDGLDDCFEETSRTITVVSSSDLTANRPAGHTISVTSSYDVADTDGDGVSDGDEYQLNGDPTAKDTDRDGLADGAEIGTYLSDVNNADSDGDSAPADGSSRTPALFDGAEVKGGTSPTKRDSDGDSLSDRYEIVTSNTNPRVSDLPQLDVVGTPGKSDVQIELGYTVKETTGTEQQAIDTIGRSSSADRSSENSRETNSETTQVHEAGGKCEVSSLSYGCSVSYKYTNSQTDGSSRGSTVGFSNAQEMSSENEQAAAASAEHEVEFESTGCMQVVLDLRNSGARSVDVGNVQILAFVPSGDPTAPTPSKLLATLLPVNGGTGIHSGCPPTASGFEQTIGSNTSVQIPFAMQVGASTLRDYLANPTPISFELGGVSLTGTNAEGTPVDFLGPVADLVAEQTASLNIDFGDGTLAHYDVAAATGYDAGGRPSGVALGEALGSGVADLSPRYTTGAPARILSLQSSTGQTVVNASKVASGVWNVVGDGQGIGDDSVDWDKIVLRPGDTVTVVYTYDSDGDGLDNGSERELGTDAHNPDTDGDGLTDYFETRVGWTVPLARGNSADYRAYSSPLSCDADGDLSPDGSGPGNSLYGACPKGLGPESRRASTTGDTPPSDPRADTDDAGTDPGLADTNGDGVLDSAQGMPDVLADVPVGGHLPVMIRSWGGNGPGGGTFTQVRGLAVDPNAQGYAGTSGQEAIYVINHRVSACVAPPCHDTVEKFVGDPRVETPVYVGTAALSDNHIQISAGDPIMGATGIAVPRGTLASGGSPVVVNFTPKADLTATTDADNVFTSFDGTSLADELETIVGSRGSLAGTYGGTDAATFDAPLLRAGQLGNGFLDVTPNDEVVIAHGLGSRDATLNASDPRALPTRELTGAGELIYGAKPKTPAVPTQGELTDPAGIALDPVHNKVYVADDIFGSDAPPGSAGALTRFDGATRVADAFLRSDDGDLAGLRGIALDPSGQYLYAVAAGSDMIYKLSPSLSILGRFGSSQVGLSSGTFTNPWDVDVDGNHNLFVTDQGSGLVQFYYYPFGAD